jgi:predicted O-linked N-acetylglucosamine transferase (SPINDLY family)
VTDLGAPSGTSANELIAEGLRRRQEYGVAAALDCFNRAAQLDPESHLPFFMLGNAASELGEFDAAVAHFERARELRPYNHVIRFNLGLSHLTRGYIEAALQELHAARELDPTYLPVQSCYFLAMHSSDRFEPEDIGARIREWGKSFSLQHPAAQSQSRPAAGPADLLRVGFVSGDSRSHSVAHFFEPIAAGRDPGAFRYVFYSNSSEQDEVTGRLRGYADDWRDVARLTDPELIDLIARDRINILVDLCGHTHGNRLAVFARRAAPVQMTYLGFPNTTGLSAIDYRITDAAADPQGVSDGRHSEKLLRLPDSQWCYRPFGPPPPFEILPARDAGFVTFGSFNSLSKASDTLLRCWAQILVRSPTSRLRLTRIRSAQRAAEVVAILGRAGVAAERIDCQPFRSDVPQGTQFAGVDIALDHYPYNGVTTTCESLYCGVPVVSWHGRHCVSRSGLSILGSMGLGGQVASHAEEYVQIALALAGDLARLEQLRGSLRARFEQSPLRDEKRFAANFEQALRTAWSES